MSDQYNKDIVNQDLTLSEESSGEEDSPRSSKSRRQESKSERKVVIKDDSSDSEVPVTPCKHRTPARDRTPDVTLQCGLPPSERLEESPNKGEKEKTPRKQRKGADRRPEQNNRKTDRSTSAKGQKHKDMKEQPNDDRQEDRPARDGSEAERSNKRKFGEDRAPSQADNEVDWFKGTGQDYLTVLVNQSLHTIETARCLLGQVHTYCPKGLYTKATNQELIVNGVNSALVLSAIYKLDEEGYKLYQPKGWTALMQTKPATGLIMSRIVTDARAAFQVGRTWFHRLHLLAKTVSSDRQTLLEKCLCPSLHKRLEDFYKSRMIFTEPDIASAQKKLGGKIANFHTRINFAQDDLTADILFREGERPRAANGRANRQRSTPNRPRGQRRTDGGRPEADRKRYSRN